MEIEGKKLFSLENNCLYETFRTYQKIKGVSFAEIAKALECTELEAARVQKYPVYSPCFRLIKLAEFLGKNAVFETRAVLNQTQTKANIRRIEEKYRKQLAEWKNTNVVPIRDLSLDEISRMRGLGAGFFELELEIEERRKHRKETCAVLQFVPRERTSATDRTDIDGQLIELKFREELNHEFNF
jgi:hypothetical protein